MIIKQFVACYLQTDSYQKVTVRINFTLLLARDQRQCY